MPRKWSGTMTRTMIRLLRPSPQVQSRKVLFLSLTSSSCTERSPARNQRTRNTSRMQEIIRAEQEGDSDSFSRPRQRKKGKRKHDVLSDPEDKPYTSTSTSTSDSEIDSVAEIAPDEVRLSIYVHPIVTFVNADHRLPICYLQRPSP